MAGKKPKSLEDVLAEERDRRGARAGTLDSFDMTVTALSTGNIAVDAITGVGGLPRGRVIELFGPPSSGKTTTALQAAALLQAKNIADWEQGKRYILYLDYERSLDPDYCRALGLDVSHPSFIYDQPSSFEDGINRFRRLMATGQLDMLIVDSVAMMTTEHELEADTGKVAVADRAKMMAQTMRQIVGPIAQHKVVAVFLNHIQEVIDASPMGQQLRARGVVRKTTPGGQSLKFNASMRIEYKQVGNLRTETYDPLTNEKVDVVKQTKVQVIVVKNKVAEPFRTAEVRVRYGLGFSQAHAVREILTAHGAIRLETGGVHRLTAETAPKGWDLAKANYIKGEEAFVSTLERDPEWLSRLTEQAQAILDLHGTKKVDSSAYDLDGDEISSVDSEAIDEALR